MVDTPQEAATRRRAREMLERLERADNTPEAIADRAARRERVRKEQANAMIDRAVAKAKAQRAAREAKAAPPAPVAKPTPRPAPPNAGSARKDAKELQHAVTQAVAAEITEHRRERELQAAKIEAALARLDAALARAESGGSDKGRDQQQSRFILSRDVG